MSTRNAMDRAHTLRTNNGTTITPVPKDRCRCTSSCNRQIGTVADTLRIMVLSCQIHGLKADSCTDCRLCVNSICMQTVITGTYFGIVWHRDGPLSLFLQSLSPSVATARPTFSMMQNSIKGHSCQFGESGRALKIFPIVVKLITQHVFIITIKNVMNYL